MSEEAEPPPAPPTSEHEAMAAVLVDLISAIMEVRGELLYTRNALMALAAGHDHFASVIAESMMKSGDKVKKLISDVQAWNNLPK